MKNSTFLDRPIAFHRSFVKFGGVTTALFLSQAIYWSTRTKDTDGWFYKTQEEWEDETGLSRYEQESVRMKLLALGILKEVKRGVPARLFYKVNNSELKKLIESVTEPCKLDCGKTPNKDAEKPQTIYTETTTETTKKDSVVQEQKNIDIMLELFNNLFHRSYHPTHGRIEKLKLRLKTYTLEQILQSITNLSKSPWHQGENDRGWVADPDFILRNDEQIDKWLQKDIVEDMFTPEEREGIKRAEEFLKKKNQL